MEDGIYLGLEQADYLAIERLSKSGLQLLMISPADFWSWSWLNPQREELTPEQEKSRALARLIGRAYHAARLEPETFADRFAREPTKADFAGVEGFLHNGTQIEAELEALGLPKKSKDDGGVLGQARRLEAAGYPHPIWHVEEAKALAEAGDRVLIPAGAFDDIRIDGERLRQVPAAAELLQGGLAEVTILYTCPDSGIPMKARLDYLRPDGFVELKTFANTSGKALFKAIFDAFAYNRYHIDAVSYAQALEAATALPTFAVIFGDIVRTESLRLPESPRCDFIFQQKNGVPNIIARQFEYFISTDDAVRELEEGGASADHLERARKMAAMMTQTRTHIHAKALRQIEAAKRDFLAYSEIYERGEPWLPFDRGGTIGDMDFPRYFLEE